MKTCLRFGLTSLVLFMLVSAGCVPTRPFQSEASHKTAAAPVEINLPDLQYFAEGRTDLLLHQLAANPEWKVTPEEDEIVCYRRAKGGYPDFAESGNATTFDTTQGGGNWRVSLNGYYSQYVLNDKHLQHRYLFRFADEGGGPFTNEYNRAFFNLANPTQGAMHLRLKSSDQGIESYLTVGQKGLWFEFFDQSYQEDRIQTREALRWLQGFLAEVRTAEEEIREKGYAEDLLPPYALKEGEPSLWLRGGGGHYDVFGRVNPGKSGYVYLKAFELDTGKSLSDQYREKDSSEIIGFSKSPNQLFYYNSLITIYKGDMSHSTNEVRFELWFRPEDGGTETKLVETIQTVQGWQR